MTQINSDFKSTESSAMAAHRVGFYASLLTCLLTIVTFGLAITAVPISGVFCLQGCITYPYLDTIAQYPKDYLWMYLAIPLILVYVVLMAAIHASASPQKKIYSQIGLSFAMITAVILLSDYFVQFAVIPISLMNGETDGIALLTQYNPHGIFITLEELGYITMALSFLFMAPLFANTLMPVKRDRLEMIIQWVFIAAFVLTIVSLAIILFNFGLDREYRFEVTAISINWLVLVINGALLSIVFRRRLVKTVN